MKAGLVAQMSKTKSKNHNELEYQKGIVRKLKSENRQLKKRLKELDKRAHFYEELVDEAVDEVEIKNSCPECNKGILQEHDFVHIIITKCNNCDYQKKRKPRK